MLTFQRPGVSGSLSISDKAVDLSIALGFLLKAMKGSLQSTIEQELDKLFAHAQAQPAAAAKPKPTAAKKSEAGRKKGG